MVAFARWVKRVYKKNSYPLLLTPITRGPLLGYYHYLTGYFVPAYWRMLNAPQRNYVLLNCGPMDKWLSILPSEPQQTIDAVEGLQTAHRARWSGFSRGYTVETFVDWDLYRHFDQRPIDVVATDIQRRFRPSQPAPPSVQPKIVVVGREHTPAELQNHPTRQFGAAKRTIPNLDELVVELERFFRVQYIDGSRSSAEEMIVACSDADILLGQHGAGLTNALFLPPSAGVIEIGWNSADHNPLGHFQALSARLGLRWNYLGLQDNPFARVDKDSLIEHILSLTSAESPDDMSVQKREERNDG